MKRSALDFLKKLLFHNIFPLSTSLLIASFLVHFLIHVLFLGQKYALEYAGGHVSSSKFYFHCSEVTLTKVVVEEEF